MTISDGSIVKAIQDGLQLEHVLMLAVALFVMVLLSKGWHYLTSLTGKIHDDRLRSAALTAVRSVEQTLQGMTGEEKMDVVFRFIRCLPWVKADDATIKHAIEEAVRFMKAYGEDVPKQETQ